MRYLNRRKIFLTLLIGSILGTGCGSQTPNTAYTVPDTNATMNAYPYGGGTTTYTPTTQVTNTSASTLAPNDGSAITGNFTLLGQRGGRGTPPQFQSGNFNTDTILSIAFGGNKVGTVTDTGYQFNSSCLSVNVALYDSATHLQIGTNQTATFPVINPNGCVGRPTNTSVSFSNYLYAGNTHGYYFVISNVNTDSCFGKAGYSSLYDSTNCFQVGYFTWQFTANYSISVNHAQ